MLLYCAGTPYAIFRECSQAANERVPDCDRYKFKPRTFLAEDGNYYLVAMFNDPYTEHQKRVADPEDDLILAARKAFAITPAHEPSFMWYRFPLGWVRDFST